MNAEIAFEARATSPRGQSAFIEHALQGVWQSQVSQGCETVYWAIFFGGFNEHYTGVSILPLRFIPTMVVS
jgi:hypothetical protein